jgi:ABC-2 type transport system permease protein
MTDTSIDRFSQTVPPAQPDSGGSSDDVARGTNVPRSPGSEQPESNGRGVNRLGYRGWSGRLESGWMRWTVISSVGIRRAWQSRWLRRMLFFAWLPAVVFGIGFFVWEQAALYPEWRQAATDFLGGVLPTPAFNEIRESVRTGNWENSRHTVWAWLLQTFFRNPQGVVMVMVVGLIAPPLISQDVRSRAFLLYFSRPLTRGEYLLGKLASVWTYLSVISTIPALALYVLGVLLSPNLSVVSATWDIPFRIVAASMVLMLPTSVLALCFSSLTQESRYAGFAWFAVWILGWFTYAAGTSAETLNALRESNRSGTPMVLEQSSWTHVSLYHTLGRVQSWVFGFAGFRDVLVSTVILVAVTVIALAILLRRISAPMRV